MTKFLGLCTATIGLVLALTTQASAQTITLKANLTGGEETPPVNTGAFATAEVSVDVGNREFAVTLKVFNIPTTTTASHIHIGPRGPLTSGPTVIDFPRVAGRTGDFALTFRVGAAQFIAARPTIGIHTVEDAIQAIVGGNSYVNIHTTQYPGGEVRGQLTVVD